MIRKILLFFPIISSVIVGFEISSKVDLDSEELRTDSSLNPNSIIVTITSEPEVSRGNPDFRLSDPKSNSGRNFYFRNSRTRPRSRQNYNQCHPRVVKNIYVAVNEKDFLSSNSGDVVCHENTCETSVTIDKTNEDDEIISVGVKVVTKQKSPQIEDVPVIDGILAAGYGHFQNPPTFSFNNIPWGPRRNSAWLPVNPWSSGKIPIDDKIESPLSKTDHAVQ